MPGANVMMMRLGQWWQKDLVLRLNLKKYIINVNSTFFLYFFLSQGRWQSGSVVRLAAFTTTTPNWDYTTTHTHTLNIDRTLVWDIKAVNETINCHVERSGLVTTARYFNHFFTQVTPMASMERLIWTHMERPGIEPEPLLWKIYELTARPLPQSFKIRHFYPTAKIFRHFSPTKN